jgi:hypothetical protein
VKNGFTDSLTAGGYRDIKVNVAINDHVCELQIYLKHFFNLKNEKGHDLYNKIRSFQIEGALNPNDLIVGQPLSFFECLECILGMDVESNGTKLVKDSPVCNSKARDVAMFKQAIRDHANYGNPRNPEIMLKYCLQLTVQRALKRREESKVQDEFDAVCFQEPQVLDVSSDLAKMYFNRNEPAISAGLFFFVIWKQEAVFGSKHPRFLLTVRDYCKLWTEYNPSISQVQQILMKIFSGYESSLGPASLETLRCRSLKALYLEPSERLSEELKIFELRDKVLCKNSIHLAMEESYRNLFEAYFKSKDGARPLEFLTKARDLQERFFGTKSVAYIKSTLLLMKMDPGGILTEKYWV